MSYDMIPNMAEPVGGRLSEALRATYRAAGITQEDMAASLGVDQPTVSKWVRGMRRPPLHALPVIEKLCGIQKGTILRAAGYVDDDPSDLPSAIATAPDLDEMGKRILTNLYSELRRQPPSRRSASSATTRATDPNAATNASTPSSRS